MKLVLALGVFGITFLILGIKYQESFCLYFAIPCLLLAILIIYLVKRSSIQESSVSDFAKMENYGELKVFRTGKPLAKAIKIVDDKDAVVKYEPKKIHIGAATVGSVTTGGVYTTGGFNYLAGTAKNGLYRLEFAGKMITKINVSPRLRSTVRNSVVSKYLDNSCNICVVDDVFLSENEQREVITSLNASSGLNVGNAGKKGYPSFEKCVEIMNWLSGNDTK